jgi:hypothetical protein
MKCPKCKSEVQKIYIEQRFVTFIRGEQNEKGEQFFDDMEAGYTQLGDWLDNMLTPSGRPKILGCEKCI